MRKSNISVVGLVLLMGCSDFMAPEGTLRMQPPAEWKVWWNEAQPCINKEQKRDWSDVEWYVTPGYVPFEGDSAAGLTHNNEIYISSYALYDAFPIELRRVVIHELVHAIDKIHDHPYDPFEKCKLMHGQRYEDPTP